MSEVLTLEEAKRLAAALFEHFDTEGVWRADRERVDSDLAGLQDHPLARGGHECWCGNEPPCDDARRYSDGLRRTAALYGVT